jgi:hypothetical protein
MKYIRLMISTVVASVMFPAGGLVAAARAECPEIWNLNEFEAAGGILTVIAHPDLENLPQKKGAGTIHIVVLRDGHVSLEGWDATFGLEATFAVEKRIALMRYAPPRLGKRPVCVGFDFRWSSERPRMLEKGFSTRWVR